MTEKEWADLSPEERREERFRRWLSPAGVTFSDEEADENYRKRVIRFTKAIKLEEPDRVPVMVPVQFFPAPYAGSSLKEVMYDYEELKRP